MGGIRRTGPGASDSDIDRGGGRFATWIRSYTPGPPLMSRRPGRRHEPTEPERFTPDRPFPPSATRGVSVSSNAGVLSTADGDVACSTRDRTGQYCPAGSRTPARCRSEAPLPIVGAKRLPFRRPDLAFVASRHRTTGRCPEYRETPSSLGLPHGGVSRSQRTSSRRTPLRVR